MRLRPYEIEDAELLYQTYYDPDYSDYWRNFKGNLKKADFEQIERIFGMQIMMVETDEVIGFLTGQLRTDTTIFVSILILKEHQQKGYALPIMFAGLNYLKEQRYHKVAIRVNPANEKLIEKCKEVGFKQEGYFSQERWSADGWKDEVMLALILEEL